MKYNRTMRINMKGNLRPIAKNMLKVTFKKDYNLDPILISFLVTTRCNFRCIYCDNGNGHSYNECANNELTLEEIKRILRIIRSKCSWINISGGEPLIRKDIIEIMKEIKRLNFSQVMFNTNGALLDKKEKVLKYIDHLVISLDTLNDCTFAKITGTSESVSRRVKENILMGKQFADEYGITCVVNSVIMDTTISDCRNIMKFCVDNGIYYSPMPYIQGKVPHNGLVNNTEYREFIREVIAAKKKTKYIFGIKHALDTILHFGYYECYPTLRMIVNANGDLFYPCAPKGTIAGNLLEYDDFDKTYNQGILKYGKPRRCDYSCHLSCYMEPSLAMKHPVSLLANF